MSGPGVGFEYPPREVSWVKRDALLFAQSIGCTADELHFLYELDPKFSVFPTYPIVLPFKTNSQEVIDFYAEQKSIAIPNVPVFDPTRVVDGQRSLQLFKPLPTSSAGKKFEIRTKVLGVYDKGRPGTVVETQSDLVEVGTNEVYNRVLTSSFYVAQGNWGGPKGPATVNFPPPKDKKPDVVFENQTTPETPLLYRLNGDYNPLHAHPEPGKKMGFGGVIIHGLYSWNWACHGLLQHLGGSDPANIKEYQARFASPVRPGDKLIAEAWRTGEKKDGGFEEIRFQVKNSTGKVVLSNGRALIKVVEPMTSPYIGQRRSYEGHLCTVRYIGKSKASTVASFVRPTRSVDPPQTFLSALQHKYAPEPLADQKPETQRPIKFSGKVAEEVGFEKIRRQQAQLHELQYVILDSTRLAAAYPDGEDQEKGQRIGQVCPKIKELDLSRNLLEHFDPVVEICAELPLLKSLRVNWNRFRNVLEDKKLESASDAFKGVEHLTLEDTYLDWREICHIASRFPALTSLNIGSNNLSSIPSISPNTFASTLVSLDLELNSFSSLADLAPLATITSLRNLVLKGNDISSIVPTSSSTASEAPVFGSNLHYVDLSYNKVDSWSFVDALPHSFPGLMSLRFTHNPIYNNPDLDNQGADTPSQQTKAVAKTEEAFMLIAARLPSLKTLNFSTVTPADRIEAEMFYLSRIAKQLATVPEAAEGNVLARHRRWAELCELHGEPTVIRQKELNPTFLEARLITVKFHYESDAEGAAAVKKTIQIPKSFDIYDVKAVAGKLFGLRPLKLKLVWETGEWDPVAGFDEDGDSSDEEELDVEPVETQEVTAQSQKGGRWVKREVELKDGPRQFGYCVDGMEVKVRVKSW
ncbi:HotDog domain-containing protein [Podospora australis]|uniref:HotDog domain-containing protein n=1 Tax=Podospora australis TaxID=1536484 RepID=A0AAN6X514_9PEZI|nr:HotDog domain-containing protein [Podospora australis]